MALPTVKLARKTVELYPDLQVSDEVDAAEDALDEARKAVEPPEDAPAQALASKARSAAKKALADAEAALEAVRERAKGSVLEVVIDQMPKKEWREFQTAHPMREGDAVDAMFAVNWDDLVGAYLYQKPPQVRWLASGEPVEVAPSEWPEWVGTLGDPEYQKLGFAIGELNARKAQRPF